MEACSKENLAGVDIPDASNFPLVEKEVLQTFPALEELLEPWKGEFCRKRVNAKPLSESFFRAQEEDVPKLPRIDEGEVFPGREHKVCPPVPVGEVFFGHLELPGHAKVQGKASPLLEGEKEVLPQALEGKYGFPFKGFPLHPEAGVDNVHLKDALPHKKGRKFSPEHLDLRKLWHAFIVHYLTVTVVTP